ncbi:uncharacterized protein PFL1_02617 [Pseudozyma flocculosa PF-1]|uniref:DASH complex subunit DAD3 n=2 Tax=Pseudozyma flocculosa TaxID=84751 RepID=A0A5C3F0N2_9BASI|nr:uncharacterized protein PFL1_02617 [Pseudozyma flocculosa PF-1]EPQ29945.1 hypothetical protein PFL1_02617 [Pseudozyma flocculosa PF-1]SPO37257.1 uncharacterized protein PSFLO_02729 [Pseudozyma flocculosa]
MATMEEVLAKVAAVPGPPTPFVNPYTGNRALSESEQELLGEYARLAGTINRVAALSSHLSSSAAHASLLSQLRVLERKMGLVLTLFKASVWAIVQEQQEVAEAEAMAAAEHDARMQMEGYGQDPALEMGLGLGTGTGAGGPQHHYGDGMAGGDSLFIENADDTITGYRY